MHASSNENAIVSASGSVFVPSVRRGRISTPKVTWQSSRSSAIAASLGIGDGITLMSLESARRREEKSRENG